MTSRITPTWFLFPADTLTIPKSSKTFDWPIWHLSETTFSPLSLIAPLRICLLASPFELASFVWTNTSTMEIVCNGLVTVNRTCGMDDNDGSTFPPNIPSPAPPKRVAAVAFIYFKHSSPCSILQTSLARTTFAAFKSDPCICPYVLSISSGLISVNIFKNL